MKYLDADAVYTTDDFSREVYRMFNQGKTEEEIINYIKENIE
jgi:cytochrome c-type biogenesis protein CcmH/NrfF